jgi:hypothetical protein
VCCASISFPETKCCVDDDESFTAPFRPITQSTDNVPKPDPMPQFMHHTTNHRIWPRYPLNRRSSRHQSTSVSSPPPPPSYIITFQYQPCLPDQDLMVTLGDQGQASPFHHPQPITVLRSGHEAGTKRVGNPWSASLRLKLIGGEVMRRLGGGGVWLGFMSLMWA